MVSAVNLQRNSEAFFSVTDLANGGPISQMMPANTWKVEILSGFAASSSASTQDITLQESGLTPNRSQKRYITSVNPVEWNFQVYLRPTDAVSNSGVGTTLANSSYTGNVKPLADWFLWQALISNTAPASTGGQERSVWRNSGIMHTNTSTTTQIGVWDSNTNFAAAQENHLYFKLDNIFYQIANATVNQATLDASIDGIATVTWNGRGTHLVELTGTPRNNAVSVFGGILNNGTVVSANSNATVITRSHSYHPYGLMNVAGTLTTAGYIKNRLSTMILNYANAAGGTNYEYTIPLTAFSFTYTNNINYITPEEINKRNYPIAQYMGARAVTGSATMYLRGGSNETAQFLRDVQLDSRTDSSATANLVFKVGGYSGSRIDLIMPAVQFDFPQIAVEDVISMSFNYIAEEANTRLGDGGEVMLDVSTI